jgi:hypothetical protein
MTGATTTKDPFPSVAELRRLVKKRERRRFSAMWFLEPIQVYFSYGLIWLGLNSIHVTVLWLCVALAGYAVTVIGTPLAFIGGCLLLYLKTILDGSDGEVARYHKQFVSEEQDLTTFIEGVYLDKCFHIIEKPLWGLALAMGLFHSTGQPWVFAAGISLAVFHGFCRHNATLQADIPRQFAERVRDLRRNRGFENLNHSTTTKDSLFIRIIDKAHLWMRNGKCFNLLVLIAAMLDLSLGWFGMPARCVLMLVTASACAAPFLITYVIVQTMRRHTLVVRALQLTEGE